ncbi:hypothetical protein Q7C36_014970 [Tachysurus vachellii]|uniref:Uncharacterized protein n=1 Tax=Tachysurus vachellii TaxID=175792 RepID=A0AA88SEL5_TACVA|nr:hypothetical protein Q7C36_014970 [Tachysurus vachellii]
MSTEELQNLLLGLKPHNLNTKSADQYKCGDLRCLSALSNSKMYLWHIKDEDQNSSKKQCLKAFYTKDYDDFSIHFLYHLSETGFSGEPGAYYRGHVHTVVDTLYRVPNNCKAHQTHYKQFRKLLNLENS